MWGQPEAFEIIRASNRPVDADSAPYYIEVLGGEALNGMFTRQHVASFDVIANSAEEARCFVNEVSFFADPDHAETILCERCPDEITRVERRGVICAYPFRLQAENELVA